MDTTVAQKPDFSVGKPVTCQGCPLYTAGQGFAMGGGPIDAEIVKVGEAPGEEEAKRGEVFVGPAGKLMNQLDYAVGVYRSRVYVMNVICCRPPGNRVPMGQEIAHCSQYFDAQMEMLKNRKVIAAMGGTALQKLTGLTGVNKWRGTVLDSKYGKVVVLNHPSAIFRQQHILPLYISDMQRVKRESAFAEVRRTPTAYIAEPTPSDIEALPLASAPKVGLDIETAGDRFDSIGGRIRLCGLSTKPGEAVSMSWPMAKPYVKALLQREDVEVGIHNAQFDLSWMQLNGVEYRCKIFDTMLALHLVSSDLPNTLDFGASVYTDMPFWKDEQASNLALYNCKDTDAHRRLQDVLNDELIESGQKPLFDNIVMPMVPVCMSMFMKGVKRDERKTVTYHLMLKKQLIKYEMMLSSAVGKKFFDWRSPQQVQQLVYKDMGLPVIYHKKTKRPTADHEALQRLYERTESKIIGLILEMRKIAKLAEYFASMPADCILHPEYLIHGTVTGRTSTKPNLQNWPRGPARQSLVPTEDGWLFLAGDYKQLEFRISAYCSGEQELIDVFDGKHSDCACKGDAFIHVAGEFYSCQLNAVNPTQRQLAKGVVYGLNYGQGITAFSNMYAITTDEAKGFIGRYSTKYSKIKAWRDRILADLERQGYIASPFGRRRYLYGYDKATKAFIFPCQSPAADIKNKAMIRMHKELPKPARLALDIHDEIIVQSPPELMDMAIECMRDVMHSPIPEISNKVFPADIHAGRNYDEASAKEGLASNWRQLTRQVK